MGSESSDPPDIHRNFELQVPGFEFLGRGSEVIGERGWPSSPEFTYRCADCGDLMQADYDDYYECRCGAMSLDVGASRFDSRHGGRNILVYRRREGGSAPKK